MRELLAHLERSHVAGCRGDRRGLQPGRRRCPQPARAGDVRAFRRASLQGLHRRRSAHAYAGGVERPAQDPGGAASPGNVHLRDHRAPAHPAVRIAHPLPLPEVRLPAARRGRHRRQAGAGDRQRRRPGLRRSVAHHRAQGRRRNARCAFPSRPGSGAHRGCGRPRIGAGGARPGRRGTLPRTVRHHPRAPSPRGFFLRRGARGRGIRPRGVLSRSGGEPAAAPARPSGRRGIRRRGGRVPRRPRSARTALRSRRPGAHAGDGGRSRVSGQPEAGEPAARPDRTPAAAPEPPGPHRPNRGSDRGARRRADAQDGLHAPWFQPCSRRRPASARPGQAAARGGQTRLVCGGFAGSGTRPAPPLHQPGSRHGLQDRTQSGTGNPARGPADHSQGCLRREGWREWVEDRASRRHGTR